MTFSEALLQRANQASACRCSQCGGSGMLRLADQRYRTCLDCLGQGQVVRADDSTTAADLLHRHGASEISVAASSFAR